MNRRGWHRWLVLALIPSLTGCWDSLKLSQRGLVLGLAVDPGPRGWLKVSAEMPVTGGGAQAMGGGQAGGGAGTPSRAYVVTAAAPTLAGALATIQMSTSRELYLGMLKLVILSERLSPVQVRTLRDELVQAPEVEPDTYLAVAHRMAAADVLSISGRQQGVPSRYLWAVFRLSRRQGTMRQRLYEFARDSVTPGVAPVLPLVQPLRGGGLVVRGLTVFRRDRLVGLLPREDQVLAVALLRGRRPRVNLSVPMGGGRMVAVRELTGGLHVTAQWRGARPQVQVRVALHGEAERVPGGATEAGLAQAGTAVAGAVFSAVQDTVRLAQQRLRADVFGLGERLFLSSLGDGRGGQWERVWPDTPVHLTVTCRLSATGQGHVGEPSQGRRG